MAVALRWGEDRRSDPNGFADAVIVASFFAPREDRWGCDYVALLRLLDASCKRFDLRHMVISDDGGLGVDTFLCRLPENLMAAILEGQRQFLACANDPVLFVGADCLITKDPKHLPSNDADIAITTSDTFSDCRMNTGAIWCTDGPTCAPVWQAALDRGPMSWGDDQTALYAAIRGSHLTVEELACPEHNWAPRNVEDEAGMPTVVHFRGQRKSFMAEWARRHIGITVDG